jgi:hypothetical protein
MQEGAGGSTCCSSPRALQALNTAGIDSHVDGPPHADSSSGPAAGDALGQNAGGDTGQPQKQVGGAQRMSLHGGCARRHFAEARMGFDRVEIGW